MGFIEQIYGTDQTTPLMTDKYHVTTAYAYWLEGRADNPAVFYMFGRKEADGAGYSIAAGLEGVIDIVKRWQQHRFTAADLAYLRSLRAADGTQQFPEAFISYLGSMTFKLKIDAAPEGTAFFPQEPVLRVEGPLAQAKMLESVALCLLNGHSAYATQAARQHDVITSTQANGSPAGSASIQGLRRGPGLGAAIEASRSLGLGGYSSTSTGTAARLLSQPFAGTMDHAWVMTHRHELADMTLADIRALAARGDTVALRDALISDAFRSYAYAYPDSGILLVDTYDPLLGLENAITVIKELRAEGRGAAYGVRFDSGDIVAYSKIALRRFAEEGFVTGLSPADVPAMTDPQLLALSDRCTVFCAAADGIDEYTAQEMRARGGFFKAWGIGTAGSHVPPLGLVYKASSVYMDVLQAGQTPPAEAMTPVMKVAAHAPVKSSNPGRINSRRFYDATGKLSHVVIYDEDLGFTADRPAVNLRNFAEICTRSAAGSGRDLLVPVFNAAGQYVYDAPLQKETWPGSGIYTTDLSALAAGVSAQLETLPDSVRRVTQKRDDLLKEALLERYRESAAKGQGQFTVDLAEVEASLPPVASRIPVFLDAALFARRQSCERAHLDKSSGGVGDYQERFEKKKGMTP